ncbi:hypothetical protein [Devosia sp. CN2-171]|uniref:hypothetical protein n=1 Tax=Devosia sp. CN2-171 TaxID=3400909 RepID=UPI003BF8919C
MFLVMLLSQFAVIDPVMAANALWEGEWTSDSSRSCDEPISKIRYVTLSSEVTMSYWQINGEQKSTLTGKFGEISFPHGEEPPICFIQKITNIVDLPGWIFDLECGGEGEIWKERSVALSIAQGDELIYYDGSSSLHLYRCAADIPVPVLRKNSPRRQ